MTAHTVTPTNDEDYAFAILDTGLGYVLPVYDVTVREFNCQPTVFYSDADGNRGYHGADSIVAMWVMGARTWASFAQNIPAGQVWAPHWDAPAA